MVDSVAPKGDRGPVSRAAQFRAIYEEQIGYVWNALLRLGVRTGDVEDVAHELFVAVFNRLPDYDVSRPIKPWLFGMAFRVASDYRRSGRYHRELGDEIPDMTDSAPLVDEKLIARDAKRLVFAALESLPMDARAVFVMHELDGMSIPEISDTLGVGVNTLYSRLRLARKQFTETVRRIQLQRGET